MATLKIIGMCILFMATALFVAFLLVCLLGLIHIIGSELTAFAKKRVVMFSEFMKTRTVQPIEIEEEIYTFTLTTSGIKRNYDLKRRVFKTHIRDGFATNMLIISFEGLNDLSPKAYWVPSKNAITDPKVIKGLRKGVKIYLKNRAEKTAHEMETDELSDYFEVAMNKKK